MLMFMFMFMIRVLLCFMWCLHFILLFMILSACEVVPLLDGLIVCLFSAFVCVCQKITCNMPNLYRCTLLTKAQSRVTDPVNLMHVCTLWSKWKSLIDADPTLRGSLGQWAADFMDGCPHSLMLLCR